MLNVCAGARFRDLQTDCFRRPHCILFSISKYDVHRKTGYCVPACLIPSPCRPLAAFWKRIPAVLAYHFQYRLLTPLC